jgi:hypothetical protein
MKLFSFFFALAIRPFDSITLHIAIFFLVASSTARCFGPAMVRFGSTENLLCVWFGVGIKIV